MVGSMGEVLMVCIMKYSGQGRPYWKKKKVPFEEPVMQTTGERELQAEGTASAKSLSKECAWSGGRWAESSGRCNERSTMRLEGVVRAPACALRELEATRMLCIEKW